MTCPDCGHAAWLHAPCIEGFSPGHVAGDGTVDASGFRPACGCMRTPVLVIGTFLAHTDSRLAWRAAVAS